MVTRIKPQDINSRIKSGYVGTQDGLAGLLSKESRPVFTYGTQPVTRLDQRMGISLTMEVQAASNNPLKL